MSNVSLRHQKVSIDPDDPWKFRVIEEATPEPVILEQTMIHAVKYTEGGCDVVRVTDTGVMSIGQYDNNANVGIPEIGYALQCATELPSIMTDEKQSSVIVDLNAEKTATRIIIHPFLYAKMSDMLFSVSKELMIPR